ANDMSDHPAVEVSWYGATAFCNYYGFQLPTEWQWQAVADYDGSYTYGCGGTIDQSIANYYDSGASNPLGLLSRPHTSPVDHYLSYGYGLNDMAGNVWEWTSTFSDSAGVIRGGSFYGFDSDCAVSFRLSYLPDDTLFDTGFRVCR
ncbi:MAG TPA: formylglycine-generating enzyme family protein, partial [Phycisphaerales bacterium]|nr:formylglycine-generating enzyme family protein [Phycisphaerales bacterium]